MKNDEKLKFLILTDSRGNPRSFPADAVVTLEQTYPYLIREFYSKATVWQLSCGGMFATQDLMDQAISYLNDWKPDFIIIHSGIIDCRPEAFTEFQKTVISTFSGPMFRFVKKYVYYPHLIKMRQVYRVSKGKFKKALKKFRNIFDESKIIYIEIGASQNYESARPGVTNRIIEYNDIIRQVYPEGVVALPEQFSNGNGYIDDNLHLSKQGHGMIADALREKISHFRKN